LEEIGKWKVTAEKLPDKAKTEESCIPLDKEMSPRVVEMLTHLIDRFASIRMTSSFARIDRLIPPLFDSSIVLVLVVVLVLDVIGSE
jgi:hypothetical protein